MNLHPREDRIVVRPGESDETTASGLVIPDTAKEKQQQGEALLIKVLLNPIRKSYINVVLKKCRVLPF